MHRQSQLWTSAETKIILEGMRLTLGGVLLIGAAVLCAIIAAATVPMFMGNRTFVVLSGSMEPSIHEGASVVARPAPSADLRVGDVIVFARSEDSVPVVHRIVDIREQEGVLHYTTQGDANNSADPVEVTLPPTAWLVWYSVPVSGYLIGFATSRTGNVLLIGIPLCLLIVVQIWGWWKNKRRTSVRAFTKGSPVA